MRKVLMILFLGGWLLLAGPAFAVDLESTQAVEHTVVQPGEAVDVFVPFPGDHLQLATVVGSYPANTILYAVQSVTDFGVTIRAYNFGTTAQAGTVVVGFWE